MLSWPRSGDLRGSGWGGFIRFVKFLIEFRVQRRRLRDPTARMRIKTSAPMPHVWEDGGLPHCPPLRRPPPPRPPGSTGQEPPKHQPRPSGSAYPAQLQAPLHSGAGPASVCGWWIVWICCLFFFLKLVNGLTWFKIQRVERTARVSLSPALYPSHTVLLPEKKKKKKVVLSVPSKSFKIHTQANKYIHAHVHTCMFFACTHSCTLLLFT